MPGERALGTHAPRWLKPAGFLFGPVKRSPGWLVTTSGVRLHGAPPLAPIGLAGCDRRGLFSGRPFGPKRVRLTSARPKLSPSACELRHIAQAGADLFQGLLRSRDLARIPFPPIRAAAPQTKIAGPFFVHGIRVKMPTR
jgi:hypothetical protein